MRRMTDEQTKDLAMIEDPDRWRHWPILPLVNNDGRHAFIVNNTLYGNLRNAEIFVWRGNMWNARAALNDPTNRIRYKNPQAVINDGWRVD